MRKSYLHRGIRLAEYQTKPSAYFRFGRKILSLGPYMLTFFYGVGQIGRDQETIVIRPLNHRTQPSLPILGFIKQVYVRITPASSDFVRLCQRRLDINLPSRPHGVLDRDDQVPISAGYAYTKFERCYDLEKQLLIRRFISHLLFRQHLEKSWSPLGSVHTACK